MIGYNKHCMNIQVNADSCIINYLNKIWAFFVFVLKISLKLHRFYPGNPNRKAKRPLVVFVHTGIEI